MLTAADMYRAFNSAVADFIGALRESFPASSELRAMQGAYSLAASSSLRLPHETFAGYVMVPYGERLRARDTAFFLETSFDAGAGAADMVGAIRRLWGGMSEADRGCVMSHIENLLAIHDSLESS